MPKIQLPDKLNKIFTTKARFIVLIGGRGSAKSESVARILTMKAQTEAADVLCGREYQNSIEESVHKLIKHVVIDILDIGAGFDITDKKIDCKTGGGFRFRGFARNSEAVKSAQNFKYSWIEEAQNLSQQSIDDLLPTIRAGGSQLFFTANPQSSADPFSKRFIVPYMRELITKGYYEDDMHLIIMLNWRDNPWHGELEPQRQWDFDHMPRAKYDHIWEGAFNDSVEDPLIYAEWFDACVDAHETLGFKPQGILIASHDPSDQGSDPKSYVLRHGSVILDMQEKIDGDVNEGADWATGLAIQQGVDAFTWDCDGLGVTLNRQITKAFEGKQILITMFKGSEKVDFPEALYNPIDQLQQQKKNKEVFKNKRAQYYFQLRDRIYRTYRAVVFKEYHDPEFLISFSSKIDEGVIGKFRSELCRMPIKPNAQGYLALYTKRELREKFQYESPNLADGTMMGQRQPHKIQRVGLMPQPIRPMGRTLQNART